MMLQSESREKENTKQSNTSPILQCLWCPFEMLRLHLYIRKNNNDTKTGQKHNSVSNNKR